MLLIGHFAVSMGHLRNFVSQKKGDVKCSIDILNPFRYDGGFANCCLDLYEIYEIYRLTKTGCNGRVQ